MVGQHLIHKELGEGIITDIDGEENIFGSDYSICKL